MSSFCKVCNEIFSLTNTKNLNFSDFTKVNDKYVCIRGLWKIKPNYDLNLLFKIKNCSDET